MTDDGFGPVGGEPFEDELEEGRTSPWTWAAGLVGLLALAVAGFLIFRLVAGGSGGSATGIEVPNLVGQSYAAAKASVDSVGLVLAQTTEESDQPVGTILSQDPSSGTKVVKGATVSVVVSAGRTNSIVPDLRGKSEVDAVVALVSAGLLNGARTDAYDAAVPFGQVISQDPPAGTSVSPGSKVSYVISKGPEPSASVSPSPSPSESASASPSPSPVLVGNYQCQSLDATMSQILAINLVIGSVTTNPAGDEPDGTWLVQAQSLAPGEPATPGTAIDLTVIPPTSVCP